MDIIGKWKTKEYHIPTDDGIQVFVPDALPSTEEYEDLAQTAQTLTEFLPDGALNILLPVPEEAMELIQGKGMEYRDGFTVVNSTTWKEQDGKFYYDFGVECGEMGSFLELEMLPDDCLLFEMSTGIAVLERI